MMHDMPKLRPHDPEAVDRELERIFAHREIRDRHRAAAAWRHDDSPWYAASVRGSEKKLAAEMAASGIDAWCPQKKVLRRVPRQRVKYEGLQPLLPGYLLVRLDICAAAIIGLKSFSGFEALLGTCTGPLPLGGKEIKSLADIDQSRETAARGLGMLFSPGETVEVTEGYLAGREGPVDIGDDRNGIVTILLEIFGRMTPVRLGVDQIKKVC